MAHSNRQPVNDGMQGVTLMPFPFMNPWNWGVMTPAQAMQSGFTLARMNIDLWRSTIDAMRVGVRRQQDALLESCTTMLAQARQGAPTDPFSMDAAAKQMMAAWTGGAAKTAAVASRQSRSRPH